MTPSPLLLPLLESFTNATTPEQLSSSLQQIITLNDFSYRCKETIDALIKQIPLIEDNKTEDSLIQSVGEFFLWFMPHDPDIDLEVEFQRGRVLASIPPIIDLFPRTLLPNANSEKSIYAVARSVCRFTYSDITSNLFMSLDMVPIILNLLRRAPTPHAIEWGGRALGNLLHNDRESHLETKAFPLLHAYSTEEAYSVFVDCLKRCEGNCRYIMNAISLVSTNATPSATIEKRFYTKELAEQLINVLPLVSDSESIEGIGCVAGNIAHSCRDNISPFITKEAIKTFIRILSSTELSLECISKTSNAISNVIAASETEPIEFSCKEFATAVLDALERGGTANDTQCIAAVGCIVNNLTARLEDSRSLFRSTRTCDVFLLALQNVKTSESAEWMGGAIGNVCCDAESARLLAAPEIAKGLVNAYRWCETEESRNALSTAVDNIVIETHLFISYFALHVPITSREQKQILETTSPKELVALMKRTDGNIMVTEPNQVAKYRSLQILLGKVEDFLVIENNNNTNNRFGGITEEIAAKDDMHRLVGEFSHLAPFWSVLYDEKHIDVWILSVLNRSWGASSIAVAKEISHCFMKCGPKELRRMVSAAVFISLLEKMEEESQKDDDAKKPVEDAMGFSLVPFLCNCLYQVIQACFFIPDVDDGKNDDEAEEKLKKDLSFIKSDFVLERFERAFVAAWEQHETHRTTALLRLLRFFCLQDIHISTFLKKNPKISEILSTPPTRHVYADSTDEDDGDGNSSGGDSF